MAPLDVCAGPAIMSGVAKAKTWLCECVRQLKHLGGMGGRPGQLWRLESPGRGLCSGLQLLAVLWHYSSGCQHACAGSRQ